MPIYEYECPNCNGVTEVVSNWRSKPLRVVCEGCRLCYASPIISAPASVRPDIDEYVDENLGDQPVLVRGRGHRRELMKQQGLEEKYIEPHKRKEVMQKLEHIKRTKEFHLRRTANG